MSGVYGDVTQFSNDECSWLLQELYRLEEEADKKPKKWEHHWHHLSHPTIKKSVRTCMCMVSIEKCGLVILFPP